MTVEDTSRDHVAYRLVAGFLTGLALGLCLWAAPRAFADELGFGSRGAVSPVLTTTRDPNEFLATLSPTPIRALVPLSLRDAVARELLVRSNSMSEADALRTAQVLCEEAESLGHDPLLFLAVIYVESYFNHTAVSVVGAEGLMQLMPPTALWMADREQVSWLDGQAFDPTLNVRLGARYLAYLHDKYKGRYDLALTAYNRGPTNTNIILGRYGKLPRFIYDFYAGKVLDRYYMYRSQYGHLPLS